MNEQPLVLLDTAFKSSFCYVDSLDQLPEIQQKWNLMIESISAALPQYFENDYKLVDIPLGMLETIGEGGWFKRLLNEHAALHSNCFPLASDMLILKKIYVNSPREAVEQLDNQFIKAFNNLFEFYNQRLSPELIIGKVNEFIEKKFFHSMVQSLLEQLVVWRDDIAMGKTNSYAYQQLCRDLAWDSLVKREKWDNDKDDVRFIDMQSGDIEYVSLQKKEIIKRLIIYCHTHAQDNHYLAVAVLFTKYAKLLNDNKDGKVYSAKEFLDPYLIECACSGFYDTETGRRREVIVLTCDEGTEKRVANYIEAKKLINQELEDVKDTPFKKRDFKPGYIVIIDHVTNSIRKIIDISKLI